MYLFLQGLKRLKKIQPKGRSELIPAEYSISGDLNRGVSSSMSHCDGALKDGVVRRTTIPIPIKFKRSVNEEAVRKFREHHKHDEFDLNLGRTIREQPSKEIGPKRLKVRGPSSRS